MNHTPFKCLEINALKRDMIAANMAQRVLLEIKTNQRTSQTMQRKGRIKAFDARHITGVSKQYRGACLIKRIVFHKPARSALE